MALTGFTGLPFPVKPVLFAGSESEAKTKRPASQKETGRWCFNASAAEYYPAASGRGVGETTGAIAAVSPWVAASASSMFWISSAGLSTAMSRCL